MPIVVLLALAVAISLLQQPIWQASFGGANFAPLSVGLYLAVSVGVAAANARISHRLAGGGSTSSPLCLPPKAIKRHNLFALAGAVWMVAGLAAAMTMGYRALIIRAGLHRLPLLGELAAAAPFITAIIVTWWLDYPFYRLLRLRAIAALEGTESANAGLWNRRQYIFYNIRHQLLFILVPVSLILLLMDSLSLYAAPRVPAAWREQFLTVGSVAAVAVVFLLCPPLIVRVWRSAPLPAGEMREQLQSACRRLKLRCRDLLVWRSANTVANAGVIGLVGPLRYVLVSDSLLANMDHRGIKAIFFHEAGHILHRHIFYSAIFAVDAAVLCSWAGAKLASLMSLGGLWGEILAASFLLPTWAMGFGALSRLFERQSDVTGAYFAGLEESPQFATEGKVSPQGAAIFAMALQQVARLNGIAARQWNWRHGSIASRVSFILWLGSRFGRREEIDRKVRLAKGLLWLALLVAAILVANEFI